MRPVTNTHNNPQYELSHLFFTLSFVGGHEYSGPGLICLILTPIGFVVDVAALPVQAVKTLTVSENDIQLALRDLKKARDLGYNDKSIADYYFKRHSTHLDRLGYKLE